MYSFRKIASQANITLPKQVTAPSYGDLEFLVAKATQNRGRYIELPFGEGAMVDTYVLTVKYIPDAGDPIWTLYKGEGGQSILVWSHASHDLVLMHGLLLSEIAGGQVVESSKVDSTFTSVALKQQVAEQAVTSGVEASAQATTGPQRPVEPSPAPPPVEEKRLEGNLRNIKIPKLLEHIAQNQLTGRLTIHGGMGAAELFFVQGAPKHASTMDNKGEVALFEIVIWEEGEFRFRYNEQSGQNTINRPQEKVLAAAADLYDRGKFLAAAGLNQDSYLIRCTDEISEVDIDMVIAQSQSLDSQALRLMLDTLDGRHTLGDVLRKRPMVKSEWVSLFYNLLKYGMVTMVHTAPLAAVHLEEMELDEDRIRSVVAGLSDPESGIMTYSAFSYFLQQEYLRYERLGGRFSLMVAEITMGAGDASAKALPKSALCEFGKYISTVKRKIDVFAHFEGTDLVLLMPDTDAAGAGVLATRIVESLSKLAADAAAANLQIGMAFGTACLPDDCRDPGMLMAAAREAKRRARNSNSHVMLFADIAKL